VATPELAPADAIDFPLRGDHIALDALLKATGLAGSGGAAKVLKDGIADSYLDKVRKGYEREREVQLKTNGLWLGWLESSARFGEDPTIVLDPEPMLKRMTAANVKASIKKYLDGKKIYQAVMLPAKMPDVPKKN
jgi:zinc protease